MQRFRVEGIRSISLSTDSYPIDSASLMICAENPAYAEGCCGGFACPFAEIIGVDNDVVESDLTGDDFTGGMDAEGDAKGVDGLVIDGLGDRRG